MCLACIRLSVIGYVHLLGLQEIRYGLYRGTLFILYLVPRKPHDSLLRYKQSKNILIERAQNMNMKRLHSLGF